MAQSNSQNLKKLLWLPIALLVLSGVCWLVVAYLFTVDFGGQGTAPKFLNDHGNLIYIMARVFLVLGAVSLVFVASKKYNLWRALGAIALIAGAVAIFQFHENSIQKQGLSDCLQTVNAIENRAKQIGRSSYNPDYKGEIAACYTANGLTAPK